MKRRSFLQIVAAVAALPFLPKVVAKAKSELHIPSKSAIPVGTIATFSMREETVPAGWLPCDGRMISPNKYPELAEILGRPFRLPDANRRIAFANKPPIDYDAYCGIRYMIKAR